MPVLALPLLGGGFFVPPTVPPNATVRWSSSRVPLLFGPFVVSLYPASLAAGDLDLGLPPLPLAGPLAPISHSPTYQSAVLSE